MSERENKGQNYKTKQTRNINKRNLHTLLVNNIPKSNI